MRIDYNLLKKTCLQNIEDFIPFGNVTYTPDGILIHQNNNSKVLAVAHLDTVLNLNHFHVIKINGDSLVFNAQLDDRLGAYTILHLLPKLGMNFDILLTEGEESGQSTAQHFTPEHEYNWMFSFDRRGDDVVMYQYDDNPTRDLLKSAGLKPGNGSFSDIAFLDHLDIKGFNVGTGYDGEHSTTCHANMSILISQINKFKKFYNLYKDTKLVHKPQPASKFTHYFGRVSQPLDNLYCVLCDRHMGTHLWKDEMYICDECFGHVGQCVVCTSIFYDDELTDGVCPDCIDMGQEWDK